MAEWLSDFARDFWMRTTAPLFSIGELIFILAIIAYKLPAWAIALLMLPWLFWRFRRANNAAPF